MCPYVSICVHEPGSKFPLRSHTMIVEGGSGGNNSVIITYGICSF